MEILPGYEIPEPNSTFADDSLQKGFSLGSLVYGPVYYYAMKDWPFFWVSLIATLTVYGTPLLIPMAFYARARAWERKVWDSGELFASTQRRWDRSAIVVGILGLLFLYVATRFVASSLETTFGTNDPNQLLQQVQDSYQ